MWCSCLCILLCLYFSLSPTLNSSPFQWIAKYWNLQLWTRHFQFKRKIEIEYSLADSEKLATEHWKASRLRTVSFRTRFVYYSLIRKISPSHSLASFCPILFESESFLCSLLHFKLASSQAPFRHKHPQKSNFNCLDRIIKNVHNRRNCVRDCRKTVNSGKSARSDSHIRKSRVESQAQG